jgi:hypothetical protein
MKAKFLRINFVKKKSLYFAELHLCAMNFTTENYLISICHVYGLKLYAKVPCTHRDHACGERGVLVTLSLTA